MAKKFVCEFEKCVIISHKGVSVKTGKEYSFYTLDVTTDMGVMSICLSNFDPAQAQLILIAKILDKS